MTASSRKKNDPAESGPPLSPIPQIPDGLKKGWQFVAPVIVLLYLILAIYHANVLELAPRGYQNAPDEPAHLSYVHVIAEGRLPDRFHSEPKRPVYNKERDVYESYEWHQPPLYYAVSALFLPLGEHSIRYLSILFGAGTLLLIFQTGRWLIPGRPMAALLAAGVAAFMPGFIAITSSVNNDSALIFFFSAWCLVVTHALNGGLTPVRARWLGVIMAGAMLSKATAVLLIPLTVFALFLMWRNGEAQKNLARGTAWILGLVFILSGWWFLRNLQLYHELLPIKAFQSAFTGTARAADVVGGKFPGLGVDSWTSYFSLVGVWSFQSFWSVFGTLRSRLDGAPHFLPAPVYQLLALVCLASGIGMGRLHFMRRTEFNQTQLYSLWVIFAMFGLTGLSFFMFTLSYFQAQGRYLYPAILPISICLSLGWRSVIPLKYENTASFLLLGFLLAVCVAYLRVL